MNVVFTLYKKLLFGQRQSPVTINDTSSIVAGIGGNRSLLFLYKEDFIEGRVGTFAVAPDVDGFKCISVIVSRYTCGIGVASVVTLSFILSMACDT